MKRKNTNHRIIYNLITLIVTACALISLVACDNAIAQQEVESIVNTYSEQALENNATVYQSNAASMVEEVEDFDVLFTQLLSDTNKSVDIDSYITANRNAYDKLLSYGSETLFYCFSFILQHSPQTDPIFDDESITKARLVAEITRELLYGETNEEIGLLRGVSLREWVQSLIYRTLAKRLEYGDGELQESNPKLYELIRAARYSPYWRFLITEPEGDVYDLDIYMRATEVFSHILAQSEMAMQFISNSELPELPSDVCKEEIIWKISQTEDGIVKLGFYDMTRSAAIWEMVYFPIYDENWLNSGKGCVQIEVA